MAKRKAAKTNQTVVDTAADAVEPMVIALAEQLGTFMGRVQKRADGWLENESLRQQVSQIRDNATQLLDRVNRAGAAAKKSAVSLMPKAKAKKHVQAAKNKGRSGGVVDAPGKRHRKPPPEELFDKRLGEPMGTQMGQKHIKRRPRGRS